MHEKHVILKAWVYGFASAILTALVLGVLLGGCQECLHDGRQSCNPVADAGRDGGARD